MGEHSINEETSEMDKVVIPYRKKWPFHDRGVHRYPMNKPAVASAVIAVVLFPLNIITIGLPGFIAIHLGLDGWDESEEKRTGRFSSGIGIWGGILGLFLGVSSFAFIITRILK